MPLRSKLILTLLLCCSYAFSDSPDPSKLKMTEWAGNGMTKDPVALSFDQQGRLFLVESARRGSVDIDMRSHRPWLLDDLSTDSFKTMRDFFRSSMATEKSDENKSWLKDRNGDGVHDYHDLKAISERIRLLEDTNNDGKADRSTLYADGFNEEFTGVAAGVMPYRGDVLMTVYPDLWRLRDKDGDGKADEREIMFRGFGVHAALDGHDLHGLTVGPEGKIYFSCGDNGFSVVTKEGRRLHHPNTGGVLRMNPDGSDLEVYAYGLRNVQEFDFDQYGNMFGVDNDGDLEDERERAVYIAEGSDSGWRLTWQFRSQGWSKFNGGMTYNPWVAEGMWKPQHADQPASITPPMQNYSVGPGGFKFNPGTCLNDDYKDFFFCVQFPVSKITAFRTQPKGSGFEMVDEHVFNSGLMVSSLNFGPDGGFYLADWIGKWQPNGEGIIYRVDDPEKSGSTEREQVKRLLTEGVREVRDLSELMGHADRRVRHLAQDEIVRRGGDAFYNIIGDSAQPQLARIHALWGLIQLRNTSPDRFRCPALPWNDPDPQIRQQCARVAGDTGMSNTTADLIRLLQDDTPLVRSHAAIAIGKVGDESATQPLIDLLKENDDADPFIRHAAVMGLARSATEARLSAHSQNASAAVRVGAILALKKKQSAFIARFLEDTDVRVRREAARAIHDDLSIPEALPQLAKLLNGGPIADEPTLRRVISANLRVGDAASAERLYGFIANHDLTSEMIPLQVEALECLAVWDQSPLVDRVEGRVRKSTRLAPKAGRDTLTRHIAQILVSPRPELRTKATQIAKQLSLPVDLDMLMRWATSNEEQPKLRAEAIKLLHANNAPGVDELLTTIADVDWFDLQDTSVEKAAFTCLAERSPAKAAEIIDLDSTPETRRFFVSQLPKIRTPRAKKLLANAIAKQLESPEPEIAIDILSAARASKDATIKKQTDELAKRFAAHPWGEFQFSAASGNAERGEEIYRTHVNAQCIRCHNAGGKGKQAGPVLGGIASRVDRNHLLEAIVDPSAKIAKGFETTTVLLEDGKTKRGSIIFEDNDLLVLGSANGKKEAIDKSLIEERLSEQQSAMPNMRDVLTPIEVRDLVEFLSTLK